MPSATERFKVGDAVEWRPGSYSRRSYDNGTYLASVEAVTAKKVRLVCGAFREYGYVEQGGVWTRREPSPLHEPFRVYVSPRSLVHVECHPTLFPAGAPMPATPTPSEDRPDAE